MKIIPRLLVSWLVQLVALGLLLFLPAGTLNYWQAWVFLMVFALSTWVPTIYLLRTNPVALERRMSGGPAAEARPAQRIVMAGLYVSFASMFVVGALDHRFGWSTPPAVVCLVGDVLVGVGLLMVALVIIQNNYAATTVRVESGQTVVSTGMYGLVRHPMYTANAIMMIGLPLALGSYWGLIFVIPGLAVLSSRIRDEEKLLQEQLAGYREYRQQVRYRLVPGMW